ncbi:MAG: DUF4142 domain-containing protein [Terricaulis sp.]
MHSRTQKWTTRSAVAALLLSAAACGQTATTPADTTTETAAPAPQMPAVNQVSTQDFIQKAAMSDMFEVAAGRLAQTRASNAAIRDFARQMVQAHTATTAGLKAALLGQADLPAPPAALDQDHQNMLNDLRNASAAEFDQKYVDNQTHAHEDALNLMQGYAQTGDNPALKAFAADTAPKVQQHLDMIRQLDHSGADEPSQSHQ